MLCCYTQCCYTLLLPCSSGATSIHSNAVARIAQALSRGCCSGRAARMGNRPAAGGAKWCEHPHKCDQKRFLHQVHYRLEFACWCAPARPAASNVLLDQCPRTSSADQPCCCRFNPPSVCHLQLFALFDCALSGQRTTGLPQRSMHGYAAAGLSVRNHSRIV